VAAKLVAVRLSTLSLAKKLSWALARVPKAPNLKRRPGFIDPIKNQEPGLYIISYYDISGGFYAQTDNQKPKIGRSLRD
jgi:hypothetical protein